MEDHTRCIRLL